MSIYVAGKQSRLGAWLEQRREYRNAHRPRDTSRIVAGWVVTFLAVGMILAGLFGARGQEHHNHPPQHQLLHEQFYSKWMRPGGRTLSCCNKEDCFPTPVRVSRFGCDAWRPATADKDGYWIKFDCAKLEENTPDSHEAPDGQSHACISKSSDTVFCAVRGSGQ